MKKIAWNSVSLNKVINDGYKTAEDKIYNYLFEKKIENSKKIQNSKKLTNSKKLVESKKSTDSKKSIDSKKLIELDDVEIERHTNMPESIQNLFDLNIRLGYESNVDIELNADVVINNCLPINYARCIGYNIGFSYWETTKIPNGWCKRINGMSEFWTTSKWAKEMFIDSGVKVPVYDFKLGVESDVFFPVLRKRKDRPFTFLSIGAPSTRKNSQMAVDAFLKLFRNDRDYKLIYKCVGEPDARIIADNGEISSLYGYSNIQIIDRDLTLDDLGKLYDEADCVLYPTSGEGWGMLPFQAIAKGIPTICTNFSACTEYADLSIPLDFDLSNKKMSGIYEGCGLWAWPKFDDLCDKMLYVTENYEKIAQYTYDNANKYQDDWSWESVSEPYYNRLCQILNQ